MSRSSISLVVDRSVDSMSPYYAAARLWLDAIIDPLETRTWISMGIEAASQSPAIREFNMGVLQT